MKLIRQNHYGSEQCGLYNGNQQASAYQICQERCWQESWHRLFNAKNQTEKENNTMSKEDYKYKRQAISAARQLCYPDYIITKLRSAQTESEICRIMSTARNRTED